LAVAADAPSPAAKQERGHAVFKYWCEPCHSRAPTAPATAGLAIKYKGKVPAALEDRKDLTVEAVKTFVRQGVFSMPPFRKTEVSDADLDALAAYLSKRH
jgi:mono/diheme cytochrome c family protein